MVRVGDIWTCRTDGSQTPWTIVEVSGSVVSLQAQGRPVITLGQTELETEWTRCLPTEEEQARALERGLHIGMTMALRELPSATYEELTERLRMRLEHTNMPEWMTPEFWSVEADPSLPNMRAHRIVPTALVGMKPTMVIDRGPPANYTASIDRLFVKADSAVMALAGLARLVLAKRLS